MYLINMLRCLHGKQEQQQEQLIYLLFFLRAVLWKVCPYFMYIYLCNHGTYIRK